MGKNGTESHEAPACSLRPAGVWWVKEALKLEAKCEANTKSPAVALPVLSDATARLSLLSPPSHWFRHVRSVCQLFSYTHHYSAFFFTASASTPHTTHHTPLPITPTPSPSAIPPKRHSTSTPPHLSIRQTQWERRAFQPVCFLFHLPAKR